MGRPPIKPKKLKDGFYLEVRNRGANSGIKIRRDTKEEMLQAIEEYKDVKDVTVLGESRNEKWVTVKTTAKKA